MNLGKTKVLVFELCSILCQDFNTRLEGARPEGFMRLGLWLHSAQWSFALLRGVLLIPQAGPCMHASPASQMLPAGLYEIHMHAIQGFGAAQFPCNGRELFPCYHEVSSMVTQLLEAAHYRSCGASMGVKRTTQHMSVLAETGRHLFLCIGISNLTSLG